MAITQKITSNLWFDNQAEEAAKYYTAVFKNSKMGKIAHYGKEGFEIHGMPAGSVMTVEFWIEGMQFLALNGGPHFKFNEAISFIVNCDTQEEIDNYWNKLTSDGGQESMCGWLKDKFGVSWQIVPPILGQLLGDKDKAKSGRVMQAMMQMKKIVIADLEKAADGK